MSDQIPVFRVGDRVRVMQTEQMQRLGYANVAGEVIEVIFPKPHEINIGDVVVRLDDPDFKRTVLFHRDCLQKASDA
jgi:hypothetical protein